MATQRNPSPEKPNGIRAVGILVHEGNVLLMRREHDGREYYTFPGGGVEDGESIEEAVVRELFEETQIRVVIKRLLYHHDLIGDSDQYFFECEYRSGTPTLGGEEREETLRGDIHEPLWVLLARLSSLILYPLDVCDWLVEDIKHGFPIQPRHLQVRPNELRQANDTFSA